MLRTGSQFESRFAFLEQSGRSAASLTDTRSAGVAAGRAALETVVAGAEGAGGALTALAGAGTGWRVVALTSTVAEAGTAAGAAIAQVAGGVAAPADVGAGWRTTRR